MKTLKDLKAELCELEAKKVILLEDIEHAKKRSRWF